MFREQVTISLKNGNVYTGWLDDSDWLPSQVVIASPRLIDTPNRDDLDEVPSELIFGTGEIVSFNINQ